jgi:hypothetical protein
VKALVSDFSLHSQSPAELFKRKSNSILHRKSLNTDLAMTSSKLQHGDQLAAPLEGTGGALLKAISARKHCLVRVSGDGTEILNKSQLCI